MGFSPSFGKATQGTWMLPRQDKKTTTSNHGVCTLAKSYLDSLHICLFWSATWLTQCMEVTLTYGHQMIARRSPLIMHLQVFCPWIISQLQIWVFELCLGHHYGETWAGFSLFWQSNSWKMNVTLLGFKPWTPRPEDKNSTKELFRQLPHLSILIRYMAAPVYGGQFPIRSSDDIKKTVLFCDTSSTSIPKSNPPPPPMQLIQCSWLPTFLLFFFLKCSVKASQFPCTKCQMGEG